MLDTDQVTHVVDVIDHGVNRHRHMAGEQVTRGRTCALVQLQLPVGERSAQRRPLTGLPRAFEAADSDQRGLDCLVQRRVRFVAEYL